VPASLNHIRPKIRAFEAIFHRPVTVSYSVHYERYVKWFR
jgi:hypothetical protein